MGAVHPDSPRSPIAMIERRLRRAITKTLTADAERLRGRGASVLLLTPGSEDLEEMGANLMNPRRRTAVVHVSLRTSAEQIRRELAAGMLASRLDVRDPGRGTA